MKELLQLLREYELKKKTEDLNGGEWIIVRNELGLVHDGEFYNQKPLVGIICTKWYGFIEWLLDENKIDVFKIGDEYKEIREADCVWLDTVIMVLSIQEDPIKYLISLLN